MHFRNLPITCLKNLGTFSMSGFVATLPSNGGAVTRPVMRSQFRSGPIFGRPALVNRQGATLNLVCRSCASGRNKNGSFSQFTKRRIRMFITIPSARNMNSSDEPP
jgi:hypothetical protein